MRGVAGITILMTELVAAMAGLNFVFAKVGTGIGKMSQMIGLAAAILILSFALKSLADVNPEGLVTAASAIGILLTVLGVFMKFLR